MTERRVEAVGSELRWMSSVFVAGADDAAREFDGHHQSLCEISTGLWDNSGQALMTLAESWRRRGMGLAGVVGDHGTMLTAADTAFLAADDTSAASLRVMPYRPDASGSSDIELRL
ncbi:hypothetical protein ABLE92_09020 [Gordonia sp. VNQ95]|jgi:hypothetical protein|uniref:hypothetical protein n=1 Tax=Gordonia TaxID=2053 RepID=UPI0032B48435